MNQGGSNAKAVLCLRASVKQHIVCQVTPSVIAWDALVVSACGIVFQTNGDSGRTNGTPL